MGGVRFGVQEGVMTPTEVLALPMDPNTNDAAASSIQEYLVALLKALWEEEEGFSGKRPLGNSGWQWDVYTALAKGGALEAKFDSDGYDLDDFDVEEADRVMAEAIGALHG